jgi:hypothetical protein
VRRRLSIEEDSSPFCCRQDGATSDAEKVGEFSGAVVLAVEQSHHVRFLLNGDRLAATQVW